MPDLEKTEWVPVKNVDDSTGGDAQFHRVPPFGVVRSMGTVDSETGSLEVRRAALDEIGDDDNPSACMPVLVNGDTSIELNGFGRATLSPRVQVAYYEPDGVPSAGETWGPDIASDGPSPAKFRIRKGGVGFTILGGAANGVVNAVRSECLHWGGDYHTWYLDRNDSPNQQAWSETPVYFTPAEGQKVILPTVAKVPAGSDVIIVAGLLVMQTYSIPVGYDFEPGDSTVCTTIVGIVETDADGVYGFSGYTGGTQLLLSGNISGKHVYDVSLNTGVSPPVLNVTYASNSGGDISRWVQTTKSFILPASDVDRYLAWIVHQQVTTTPGVVGPNWYGIVGGGFGTDYPGAFGSGGNYIHVLPRCCFTQPGEPPVPPVAAAFSADDTSGESPFEVTFTDETTGDPGEWEWDFGDGDTSTEQNPVHTYAEPGTYTVSLTARNTSSEDTETKTNYITASSPVGSATFTAAGADTWTVPAGVVSARVKCYGAGGGGAGGTITNQGGGGGGGGGYAEEELTVSAEDVWDVTVGAVGTGGTAGNDGTAGGNSLIEFSSTTYCEAGGGDGGVSSLGTGGAGGNGITGAEAQRTGGTGGAGATGGGGGGECAGSAAGNNGSDAIGGTGGAGGTGGSADGGDGGNGANNGTGNAGANGSAPGGGGGGGSGDMVTPGIGGDGAVGRVVISWPA